MSPKDYYSTLSIPRDASKQEIKKAYRSLAKKFHPDSSHSEDSVGTFKKITEAYDTLSDQGKKNEYDASLSKAGPISSHHRQSHPETGPYTRKPADHSQFNKQVKREHNASLRPKSRPSYANGARYNPTYKYLRSYRAQRNFRSVMGILLGLTALSLLFWALFRPRTGLKKRKVYYTKGLATEKNATSINIRVRQQTTLQIRDELYRDLIAQPQEKQPGRNRNGQSDRHTDNPSIFGEGKNPDQSGKEGDLLEEIWSDIEDARSAP